MGMLLVLPCAAAPLTVDQDVASDEAHCFATQHAVQQRRLARAAAAHQRRQRPGLGKEVEALSEGNRSRRSKAKKRFESSFSCRH